MTENKYKHAASSADSTEIASSHSNNAQGESRNAGGSNTKPKEKKNDSEATVALTNTQFAREKDEEPHDSSCAVGPPECTKWSDYVYKAVPFQKRFPALDSMNETRQCQKHIWVMFSVSSNNVANK
ncbi:uncharacterized protein LOC120775532 [Bactrocera tryoni]|uniref:uncharacterized protein LOC120775532 n=1 Tax=Bactrocera tryoni TaxID=59916 RepID=UPI001A980CF3|nr:uncharacterized protein LOC120775532 [Bactrocera tryoni]